MWSRRQSRVFKKPYFPLLQPRDSSSSEISTDRHADTKFLNPLLLQLLMPGPDHNRRDSSAVYRVQPALTSSTWGLSHYPETTHTHTRRNARTHTHTRTLTSPLVAHCTFTRSFLSCFIRVCSFLLFSHFKVFSVFLGSVLEMINNIRMNFLVCFLYLVL